MKLLGMLLVVVTGLGCGGVARERLRNRIAVLQQAEALLWYLAEQIRCTAAPLDELLCACETRTEFAHFPLLADTVARLGEDGAFREAWTMAVELQRKAVQLSEEECEVMTQAICRLGMADATGDIRGCEQYAERLHVCAQNREEELRVRGRLYLALGLCGGCAAALLLW